MNIGELAKGVAGTTGTSEAEAKAAIAAVFEQIAGAAAKGEEVSIAGFGKFAVKDRPERQGRNPSTGEGHDHRCIEEGLVHARQGSEGQALRPECRQAELAGTERVLGCAIDTG